MKKSILITICTCISFVLMSQQVAIKTNLLYGATLTPNLGVEIGVGSKSTIEATIGYAPFDYGENKKFKHILVQPEYRYWLCDQFIGSFFGFNMTWAAYNMGGVKLPLGIWKSLREYRYEGQVYGFGFTYGYQYPITTHWSVEGEIGIGYWHVWNKKYRCEKCASRIKKDQKNYIGPSRAAINIVYQF